MTPDPLTAALTLATLAVAGLIVAFAKRQLGKSAPALAAPAAPAPAGDATDTGSYETISAMLDRAIAKGLKPMADRLDRIEGNQDRNQATASKRLGLLETAWARLDERTRKP